MCVRWEERDKGELLQDNERPALSVVFSDFHMFVCLDTSCLDDATCFDGIHFAHSSRFLVSL